MAQKTSLRYRTLIFGIIASGLFVLSGAVRARTSYADGFGIVGIAERYLGTPYRYGGNTPSGFDCSGFTGYVYQKAGFRLPRSASDQYRALNPIRIPQTGDLVFFRIDGKRISHVGIYVGKYRFIHSPRTGKSVEYADLRTKYWKKRYAGARTVFRVTKNR